MTTTRREFLQTTSGALAGLAFVGCELMAAAPARAQARRREVVVSGKRVKTVDVHAHCAVPEALALMNLKLDRKSTRLNSSHGYISYAVFCLKKKKKNKDSENVAVS